MPVPTHGQHIGRHHNTKLPPIMMNKTNDVSAPVWMKNTTQGENTLHLSI